MAPRSGRTTSGNNNYSDPLAHVSECSGQNEAGSTKNEAATLTLKGKVALCAALMASESMSVFSSLNEMPLQQTLGTPVYLLTVPGAVSASTALLLVPLVGWFADRGSHPRHRKKPLTFAAFCVAWLGLCLNLSATLLSTTAEVAELNYNHTIDGSLSFEDWDNITHEVTTLTPNPEGLSDVDGFSSLSLPAVLSMGGFIFMDLAFDLSASTGKALVLTHSDPADHVSLLVTGVVMGALGGCFTSVTGLVNFGNVLPNVGPVCSQAMFQLSSLIVLSLLCCTCTLLSASRLSSPVHFPDDHPGVESGHQKTKEENGEGGTEETNTPSVMFSRQISENVLPASTPGEAIMSMSTQLEASFRGLSISTRLTRSLSLHLSIMDNENTPLLQGNSQYDVIVPGDTHATNGRDFRGNRKFKIFILWLAAFFSGCSIFTFNITIADFVGKVIYGGNPQAETNSEEYLLYQQGMRTAALCIVITNSAYVAAALCQNKVLAVLDPKVEFTGVKVVLMLLLLTMRQTTSLWVTYLTGAVVGLSRASLFTVPFVLATRLCCQQQPKETGNHSPTQESKPDEAESSNFGSMMGLMTSSVPSAYLVVNAIIGPLVDVTGDPSAPMLMAIVCSFLAALTICCYKY